MKINKTVKLSVALAATLGLAFAPAAHAGTTWKTAGATSVSSILDLCKASFTKGTGDDYTIGGGGSSAGKTAIKNKTVDFAFSDSIEASPIEGEIHLPTFV